MRAVCALAVAIAATSAAYAEPAGTTNGAVALLPLDADARLELYGQPVASELARALTAGGVEVVVVGAKMEVPTRARLIIDGTITHGAGDGVALSVRVRDRASGTVLDKLDASAPSLTQIDRAAADLANHVVPTVKGRLAVLDQKPAGSGDAPAQSAAPAGAPHPATVQPQPEVALRVATAEDAARIPDALAHALTLALEDATHRQHFHDATSLAFELTGATYNVEAGTVPLATFRAHVKLTVTHGSEQSVVFDRGVVTDTVVGDKNIPPDSLAARTGRAVFDILDPNLRRTVTDWKR